MKKTKVSTKNYLRINKKKIKIEKKNHKNTAKNSNKSIKKGTKLQENWIIKCFWKLTKKCIKFKKKTD